MEDKPREKFPFHPRIVFMGTPDFSVPSLKALIEHGHNVLAAVTQPDRPKGRGRKIISCPVKRTAMENKIEVLQPEKASDRRFCELIRSRAPDLLVVVAFGQLLKKRLLEIAKWGALNIHASLLPKYRGAAPIHWAILNNEDKTGLTAMRMDEGLDTGPILLQKEVPICQGETAGELHGRISILAGSFLIEVLRGLREQRLSGKAQDHAKATYASKISRRAALVNWDLPADAVSAQIRAFDPWPGAFTTLDGKEIRLFSSCVINEDVNDFMPGRVRGHSEGALEVETAKGIILIRELQIPGKRRLAASDFLRGFTLREGTVLGR